MFFSSAVVAILAATAAGFPAAGPAEADSALVARQSSSSDDLENGPCRQVTFIFARGSTEAGNMGTVVGPQTCAALKSLLGSDNVACQGVGGPYLGTLIANTFPRGTSDAAIQEATRLFTLANTKCPNTIVTSGGYSQGTAVIAGALSDLSTQAPAVANQVAGAVLFGYTRNKQNGGRIPNYPTEQTKVYCAQGDAVCDGLLVVLPPHYTYGSDAGSAAEFLAQRVATG
ncbi:carbohydrate esterase family 5 protein [Cercospora zeae-maydis SCOH1-5]|uniref:Cutinase n=1 Tax=Cercospora zeae-maydis SCOH1-5 TaxID=717836 RepID=A0A6A6F619_9PEZI|nr:carbohydrate esterase family 5 protein [Cercospora zeae-maydis SCOH1-5]